MNNLGNNASYFPAFVSDSIGDKIKFYTVGSGAAGSMYKSHAETAAILNTYLYVNTITLDFLWHFKILFAKNRFFMSSPFDYYVSCNKYNRKGWNFDDIFIIKMYA